MFVRRKLNKSGSISVQVLDKRDGRSVLVRSFGLSKIEAEVCEMERRAHDFINTYGGQTVFDFEAHLQSQRQTQLDSVFSRIVDIRQNATQIILERIYGGIGFGAIGDDTLRLLAIARVCQPKSKVATVDYLKRCFHEDVKLHKVYRYMDTLYNTQREKIQNISVAHTRGLLGGRIGIVFYDALLRIGPGGCASMPRLFKGREDRRIADSARAACQPRRLSSVVQHLQRLAV